MHFTLHKQISLPNFKMSPTFIHISPANFLHLVHLSSLMYLLWSDWSGAGTIGFNKPLKISVIYQVKNSGNKNLKHSLVPAFFPQKISCFSRRPLNISEVFGPDTGLWQLVTGSTLAKINSPQLKWPVLPLLHLEMFFLGQCKIQTCVCH